MPTVLEQRIHAPTPPRKWRPGLVLQRLALVAIIVAIWWIVSLGMPHFILPGPPRVFEALSLISANGDLWHNLAITLGRVAAGFFLAVAIGLPLGILLGAQKRLGEFFEPIIPVMNTVSSAIWAIFAIIWFGVSNATTIFVVFMTAMPLIVTTVWQGTRTVNADFIELAHTLRMPRHKVMVKIYLPTILPYFFRGAARFRLRLARVACRRDAGLIERCRISAAPSRGPHSDRSGVCMDDHARSHDGRA